MKAILFVSLFLTVIAVACTSRAPDQLIDEETYKRMFIEFAIVNQMDSTLLNYRERSELHRRIYEHYNVTEEQFSVSHEYYELDVDGQIQRINEITEMLQGERDPISKAEQEFRTLQQTPDTLRH